jgi:hypothetical protein
MTTSRRHEPVRGKAIRPRYKLLLTVEFYYYGGGVVVNFVARPANSVWVLALSGADLTDKFLRTGRSEQGYQACPVVNV